MDKTIYLGQELSKILYIVLDVGPSLLLLPLRIDSTFCRGICLVLQLELVLRWYSTVKLVGTVMEVIQHLYLNMLTQKVFLIQVVYNILLQHWNQMMDMKHVKLWISVEIAILLLQMQVKLPSRTVQPVQTTNDSTQEITIECLAQIK